MSKDILSNNYHINEMLGYILRQTCDLVVEINLITGNYSKVKPFDSNIFTIADSGEYDSAIRMYADQYIIKTDRQLFLHFFSLSSLIKLQDAGEENFVFNYHIIDDLNIVHWIKARYIFTPYREINQIFCTFQDITKEKVQEMKSHVIDQYDIAIRNIYDELFELNITMDFYQIVYCAEHKFVPPPQRGCFSDVLPTVADQLVYQEDREQLLDFFNIENIHKALETSPENITIEFRKKHLDGGYKWVSMTLLPMPDPTSNDEIILCFIMDIHKQKQLEKLLYEKKQAKEHECFIENLYNSLDCGICKTSNNGLLNIIYANNFYYSIFGYTLEQAKNEGFNNVLFPVISEDLTHMNNKILAAIASHMEHLEIECRAKKRNGEIIWVLFRLNLLATKLGNINSVCFDITDRKLSQVKIAEQRNFYDTLYNTVTCGIAQYTNGTTHQITHINKAGYSIFGYESEEQFLSSINCIEDLIHQSYRKRLDMDIKKMLLAKKPFEFEHLYIKKDDSCCWISGTITKILTNTGEEIFQMVFNDITKQKQLEADALYSHAQLQAIFDNMIFEIALLKISGNTVHPIFLSYSPDDKYEECTAQFFHDLFSEDYDILMQNVFSAIETYETKECIYRIYTPDNKIAWFQCSLVRIPYSESEFPVILALFNDITEKKQMELELASETRQTLRDALATAEQANHAKTEFLSRMSHDIRTPLNAIIGITAIASISTDNAEKVSDYLSKINVSAKYLLSLINDILDMAKIESGKLVLVSNVFEFSHFIDDIAVLIHPQATDKKINFSLEFSDSLEHSYIGDSLRLNQIIVNLLSNSIKFTPAEGNITLHIAELSRSDKTALIQITISDDGIGMSEDFLSKLYEPFEQAYPEPARNQVGTGLGLSIVKNLVHLMNGTISVTSQIGSGTTFTVKLKLGLPSSPLLLPSLSFEKQWEDTNDSLPMHFFQKEPVLLVEDNELNMEIAKTLLGLQNLTVVSVKNGALAVESFKASPVGYYKAILMDIRMPVMDGLTATQKIRTLPRADSSVIPIIAMTANAFDEDREIAYKHGMSFYLTKPIEVAHLNKLLSGLFLKDS